MSEVFTVVASVGTYHQPFDRFVRWLEPWTTHHNVRVVFQHGATRHMRRSENHEMLLPSELLAHYRTADAIVLQGGAGGVMDAREAGRIPIVVPRLAVDREAVDTHQLVLCRKLADLGMVHVAESAEELTRLLDGTRAGTVPSRLGGPRSSPGVTEASRLLSSGATSPRSGQGGLMLAARRLPRPLILAEPSIPSRTREPGLLLALTASLVLPAFWFVALLGGGLAPRRRSYIARRPIESTTGRALLFAPGRRDRRGLHLARPRQARRAATYALGSGLRPIGVDAPERALVTSQLCTPTQASTHADLTCQPHTDGQRESGQDESESLRAGRVATTLGVATSSSTAP